MNEIPVELSQLFGRAVASLDERFVGGTSALDDASAARQLHNWLDFGGDLPWADPEGVTPDEWFFVTTLYGQMTTDGQRTHIRRFFQPLFVEAVARDVRNFRPGVPQFRGLRSPWMARRLCRMAEILRERGMSMSEYVQHLRELEQRATPEQPMPALDAIMRDHGAGEAKTLSVFVRDCVGGNCFPIDSRVVKELARWSLPGDERLLVGLSLARDRNPRQIARMFYEAGGE